MPAWWVVTLSVLLFVFVLALLGILDLLFAWMIPDGAGKRAREFRERQEDRSSARASQAEAFFKLVTGRR